MKESTKEILQSVCIRYPEMEVCRADLINAADVLCTSYSQGGKALVCGNGGSAADAQHIVGELMKSFILPRKLPQSSIDAIAAIAPEEKDYINSNLQCALPAISLVGENALLTAYANDMAPDLSFAQQVLGYGRKQDVLIGISTSGNSRNVLYAAIVAKAQGMKVIGLTGDQGGRLARMADVAIKVPRHETYQIQELHLPTYHALCLALENEFFG